MPGVAECSRSQAQKTSNSSTAAVDQSVPVCPATQCAVSVSNTQTGTTGTPGSTSVIASGAMESLHLSGNTERVGIHGINGTQGDEI